MIRIKVSLTRGKDMIEITGHAKPTVCAGVSAVVATAALGLKEIADTYPDHVRINFHWPTRGKP